LGWGPTDGAAYPTTPSLVEAAPAFFHAGPATFTRHIQLGFTRAALILPITAEDTPRRLTREEMSK
jgi:hypothetical protein